MRYDLFQKFFGKMVEIKETPFLSTRGMILMFGNCMFKKSHYGEVNTHWNLTNRGLPMPSVNPRLEVDLVLF